MQPRLIKSTVLALTFLLLAAPVSVAVADEEDGHELAYMLHEDGTIRSLTDILGIVLKQTPGDVVAIDLIQSGAGWIYRIQIVGADGHRSIVDVDAGAAIVLDDQESD